MENRSLPDYITFLLDPDIYPHDVSSVELIQTHISYIIRAGDFVYKWKKDIDLGFLDFSTLEKRKYYCIEELHLNRRLCPDIYLECVAVTGTDGSYRLASFQDGCCVEYGVKMRRLPDDAMMGALLQNGKVDKKDIRNIADTLVPFYETAEVSLYGEFGTRDTVGAAIYENFSQTDPFIGSSILPRKRYETIYSFSKQFLVDKSLFERRKQEGFVRDCHGDLHSGNICLDNPVHIFDCIEFNKRLRITDIAADLAFLAMDLEYWGKPDLSSYLIKKYSSSTGDEELYTMLNFYKCYRAYVRGKIGLLTSVTSGIDQKAAEKAKSSAERYFKLAENYASNNDLA